MLLTSPMPEEGPTYTGPHYHMQFVSAFVSSRLDYCNSTLAGLPKFTITHLQRVQNAAVRLVCGLSPQWSCDVTKSLHIVYKLCLMMHNVHTRCIPGYIKEMAGLPNRSRQCSSASTNYKLPAFTTRLKSGFFVCLPCLMEQFSKWTKINIRHYQV